MGHPALKSRLFPKLGLLCFYPYTNTRQFAPAALGSRPAFPVLLAVSNYRLKQDTLEAGLANQ